MSEAKIETPEAAAWRLFPFANTVMARETADFAIRVRDEQIGAVAIGLAEEAKRTARAIEDAAGSDRRTPRTAHLEGQASAFRAIAAVLRGAT